MFLERTKYKEYVLTEKDKEKIINYGKISFPDSLDLDSVHVFCQDVLFNHTRLILGFGYASYRKHKKLIEQKKKKEWKKYRNSCSYLLHSEVEVGHQDTDEDRCDDNSHNHS